MSPWLALLLLAGDLDQEIETLRQRTAELEPRVQVLQSSYLQSEVFDRPTSIKQRIAEGETLHLLGDHARASVLLFDVVSDPQNTEHQDYDLALYYLAESSFLARNIIGARHYFRELIGRKSEQHLFDAFERLLQIAATLQDYGGVEDKIAELKEAGKGVLRPDVAYLYGKSLSHRGMSEEALAQLEVVPLGHKYRARARYVIAAEFARNAQWDEALRCFDEVVNDEHPLGLGAQKIDERNMRELAQIAKGRVWADRGDVAKAMEGYAAVSKDSPYLTTALYEIAWMSVQSGELRRALQAIDILLLGQNDRLLAPKAQLLKGNILLRLGRMNDAIDAFNRVNEVYEPVHKELSDTLAAHKDPAKYFNEIIKKNHGVYNAGAFLPPLAMAWIGDEREVGRAIGVANDLFTGQSDIGESKAIAARVLQTIASKPPLALFPLFQEGSRRAADATRDLQRALETLLSLSKKALGATIDLATQAALDEAAGARLAAQSALLDEKARREALTTDQARKRVALALLENDVAKLRTELNGEHARLVALQRFHGDKATVRAQADSEARVVDELERQLQQARALVKQAKIELLPQHGSFSKERDAYDTALARELGILLDASKRMNTFAATTVQKLWLLRDRLGAIDAGLRSFNMRLQGVVEKRALQIAGRVETELRQVEVLEAALAVAEKDSRSLIGGIAHRSFEDVRQKFYDLVLKADVGLIDVVWKEKDERTDTINELVKAQKDALKALDHDFDELFSKARQ